MNSAIKLFASNGFHGTKVDDIAEEAGFSKGTFYYYFKSKENIVLEIMKEKIEAVEAEIQENANRDLPFDEAILQLIKDGEKRFEQNRHFFHLIFSGTMRHGRRIPKSIREIMFAFIKKTIELVEKSIVRYRDEIRDDLSIREAVIIFMSITKAPLLFCQLAKKEPGQYFLKPETIASVFKHGVCKKD